AGHDLTRPIIHRAGWPFIAVAVAADALAFALAGWPGWIGVPIVLWVFAFFRDPDRKIPAAKAIILAPADGRLLPLARSVAPPELGLAQEIHWKISIFMSVFDVHVNRMPCDGTVTA